MEKHSSPWKRLGRHLPEALFALLWLALTLLRLDTFGKVSDLLDCQACLVRQALPHELQFLALALAMHVWSARSRSGLLRIGARFMLALTFLLALADAFVTRQFLVRLHLHELLKFIDETDAAFDFLRVFGGAGWPFWALTFGAGLGLAILLLYTLRARSAPPVLPAGAAAPGLRRHWAWGAPLLSGLLMFPLQERNVHSPFMRNAVLAFFEPQTRFQPYAPATPPPAPVAWSERCVPGQGRRPDVILLVVESLSADQSRAWGASRDWWPELDQLQSRGVAHRAYLANGFTTEDGLVALLTGQPPIPRPDRRELFRQFAGVHHTVAHMLAQHGYQTAFLTSGDLGFLDKGQWLHETGFAQLQGHDHPDYEGLPRYHFQAPPDEALYRHTLRWMETAEQGQRQPYFLTVETVSTHQPYTDPRSGERSMEGAFRYADAALGDFVRALDQKHFFERGLLIITGDHRAMVPVAAEQLRMGGHAHNHIPFLAIGDGVKPQQIETLHSQTDLLPTLQQLVSDRPVCLTPAQGLLLPLPEAVAAECVPMRRAYDADQVFLRCGDAEHVIELEAERTRYVSKGVGPGPWLAWVQRLRRGQED